MDVTLLGSDSALALDYNSFTFYSEYGHHTLFASKSTFTLDQLTNVSIFMNVITRGLQATPYKK